MSGCQKCWDTPCTCGYEYGHWPKEKIQEQIGMLKRVLRIKENREAMDGEKCNGCASNVRCADGSRFCNVPDCVDNILFMTQEEAEQINKPNSLGILPELRKLRG